MGTPFECAPRRIDINRRPSGDYYCEYSKVNNAGKRVTAKLELNSAKVEGVLSQLSCMSLPISPEFGKVCDGEDVEVEILGQGGKVKFSWYGAALEEWAVLKEIALNVGRATLLISSIWITAAFGLTSAFIFAAVATLLMTFLNKEVYLQ